MRISNCITTIDSHTAGMPTRMVVAGAPYIPGETLAEKRQYVIEHLDAFVRTLLDEPRGHRAMRGAIITPPTTKEAHAGVVFIGGGCMPSCGHSTIGVVTTLLETGMIPPVEPVTEVVLETPAGLVRTKAVVKDGKAVSVSMVNVPAFLYSESIRVDVPGVGPLEMAISFGGNFNAILDAGEVGLEVRPENAAAFIDLAGRIRRAVNETVRVVHPEKPFINHVSHIQFSGLPMHPEATLKNIVISPPGFVDRSPCGTGTCARMAHLYFTGKLKLGDIFVHESVIGTLFRGRLLEETKVGGMRAVVPEITGSAFITGIHQFVVDPEDPVKHGFTLE